MKETSIKELRRLAIAGTLFPPLTLKEAIETLGFVQCDPIRAPARAQDLILRQRVKNYRAGGLERQYPDLGVEEDYLYAYGVVPETTWRLLHPRVTARRLSQREERVRALVCGQTKIHPRELEAYLGRKREVNAWGSYSKATTRTLEALHYRGVLRVAGREKGIRLYQAARTQDEFLEPDDRLRKLVLLIARILAPVPERSLRSALGLFWHAAPFSKRKQDVVKGLMDVGDLGALNVDGVRYLQPGDNRIGELETPPSVRFLAPFDPLVWDRYRFEHLWGWRYRFEAYTPPAKRKMGYYAMPILWADKLIGWVNVQRGETLGVEAGFVDRKPNDRNFRNAFDDEVERLREFLKQED